MMSNRSGLIRGKGFERATELLSAVRNVVGAIDDEDLFNPDQVTNRFERSWVRCFVGRSLAVTFLEPSCVCRPGESGFRRDSGRLDASEMMPGSME